MAVLSLLLSFLAKKVGTLVQAIFGWSITALFGQLPGKKQMAVTIALVLSLAWPIFVVGLFVPSVAGWAIAFLPLESWVSAGVLRTIWAALAVTAPPVVGLLVHWAAPSPRGSWLRSAIGGYPLALGFFAAFLVTAATVPVVKLASIVRGWSDAHVYVQPREGQYRRVVRHVAEAAARAGSLPEVVPAPLTMTLATKILRALARGAVSPMVPDEVLTLRADGLEVVLYPADLLLRGKAERVARVRAKLATTSLEADAWLVASEPAQRIQDELGRLSDVLSAHGERPVGKTLDARLAEVWDELEKANLPYDEWVFLEAMGRRLERRIVKRRSAEPLPLDISDDMGAVATAANRIEDKGKAKTMSDERAPAAEPSNEEASTASLVREVVNEAKDLVRLEIEIATREAELELQRAKLAAIGLTIGLAIGILGLGLLAVMLLLAASVPPVAGVGVAVGFLVVAGVAAMMGYSRLPTSPFARIRNRISSDLHQIKEHAA